MECSVWSLGFGVYGLEFRVYSLGLEFKNCGLVLLCGKGLGITRLSVLADFCCFRRHVREFGF